MSFILAGPEDVGQFERVADDVFDGDLSAALLASFLSDARHHIVLARDGETIVGFVSAIDYVHPDKPRELWINEVGVAGPWQGKGIAKRLLAMILEHGRKMGCGEAWVLTEPGNAAANALYKSVADDNDAEPAFAVLHSFKLT